MIILTDSPNSTTAQAHLWIIELHNGDDSRLTHALINEALKPALDLVEREWREQWRAAQREAASSKDAPKGAAGAGALIIIGNRSQDKFFSNGASRSADCEPEP